MQSACRNRKFSRWAGSPAGGLLKVAVLCAASSGALAASPPTAVKPGAPLALAEASRTWASAQGPSGGRPAEFEPIDARVRAVACADWRFDQPFVNREMVRARCDEPRSQFFLRLRAGAEPSSRAPAAATPAPSARPGTEPVAAARHEAPAAPAMRQALVAMQDLRRGARLTLSMVSVAEVQDDRQHQGVLSDTAELEFAEVVRDIRAGTPLRASDFRPATLVKRGQLVQLVYTTPGGLTVAARVEALQDGKHGELIRLLNRESGKTLSATVSGVNAVRL